MDLLQAPVQAVPLLFPPVWHAPTHCGEVGARVPRQRLVMSTGIFGSTPSRRIVASMRP